MKTRRKSIKVWVSDEERVLLEAKSNYYGYKRLATYIRDAIIFEKVTRVDLKGRKEIYAAYSENTKELKKIAKEFRHLNRYATQLSNDDLKEISSKIFELLKGQKQMLNLIEKKLNLEIWQEINHSNEEQEIN